ncbi:MAG: hypothetical protein H7Z13_04060 [Ferruginibacter sp.]|nr:hypothetical protein [Ferruginibacter sp.]
MGNSNQLFESLFKRKLSATDTRDYLTQLTSEHPYFSPAQFFLLFQLEKGTIGYRQQVAKTSLLFNNPYWLQFQLEEMQQRPVETGDHRDSGDPLLQVSENGESLTIETIEPRAPLASTEAITIDHPAAGENITPNEAAEVLNIEPLEIINDFNVGEEPVHAIPDAVVEPGTGISTDLVQDNITEPGAGDSRSTGYGNHEIIAEDKMVAVSESPAFSDHPNNAIEVIADGVTNTVKDNKIAVADVTENESEINQQQSVHFNNDSSPLINETETGEDPVNDTEILPLNFRLNIDTADTTEENLTFEPLHATDYFASLGIKLSGEVKSSDKLGKQLKSFTEWLKTMKKIHGDQLTPQSGQTDLSIQKLAEQSNKQDAVVTEAMADVLLHQGRADKAIEVYKKLSLLNPYKSAYFAAKIDQLKEH